MNFSFELKTNISAEKIWAQYADVNKWFTWEENLEGIALNGEFVEGTTGEMKLSGQPTMNFTLVSVSENKHFTDKTSIPTVGDIYFIHELSNEGQHTLIKHSVEFVPLERATTKEDANFIARIFSDVPSSVFALVEASHD
ncbi:hypothetical protein HCJ45_14050 [Listeria sp. FSL L7-1517]|uniref:hypothetical protein n=1 Tax=Listeria immobilis TaxID=2713502 RepID=UPI00164D7A24|nr:hypothetical protein [Listeria immobilis]MBC6298231.1 hypothetical protein [Listeria immobilis]